MTLMSTTGYAADGGVGGTIWLGETTVATLHNAPVITLFANGAAITLLLDTGAQTSVLAPDAAERIGARRPPVESSRQMQAIAGKPADARGRVAELHNGRSGDAVATGSRRAALCGERLLGAARRRVRRRHAKQLRYRYRPARPPPRALSEAELRGAAPAWTGPYSRISVGRSLGDHLCFPAHQNDWQSLLRVPPPTQRCDAEPRLSAIRFRLSTTSRRQSRYSTAMFSQ
jgi:hypothetical protein